jgi:hypothetical protein
MAVEALAEMTRISPLVGRASEKGDHFVDFVLLHTRRANQSSHRPLPRKNRCVVHDPYSLKERLLSEGGKFYRIYHFLC